MIARVRSIALAASLALAGCASEPAAKPAAMPESEAPGARDTTQLVSPREATSMPPSASGGTRAKAGGGVAGGTGVGSGTGGGGRGPGTGTGTGRGGSGGTGTGGSGGGSGSGASGGASGGSAGNGGASPGGSGASGAQGTGGSGGSAGASSGGSAGSNAAGGAGSGGSSGSGSGSSAGGAPGGSSGGAAGGASSGAGGASGSGGAGGSSGAGASGGSGASGASSSGVGASGAGGAQGVGASGASGGAASGGGSSAASSSGGAQGAAGASGNSRGSGTSGSSTGAGAKGGGGAGSGSSGGSQDHLVAIGSTAGPGGVPARVPPTARGSSAATPGEQAGARSSASTARPASGQPAATTGGVVRAAAFGGDEPDRIPDSSGQSPRGSNARGKPEAGGVVRGSSLDTGMGPAANESKRDGATSGASQGEREGNGVRSDERAPERLDVPEMHRDAGEPLDETPPPADNPSSPLRALHAHWQQVAESGNDADFGPGGFDLSLLSIRPTQKSLALHRAWGDPTLQQVGGEFRAEFLPEGTLRLSPAPAAPSRFDPKPIALPPQAGASPRTITPPTRALPLDTTWKLESPDLLRLDGRLYRRIDERAFEQLRRGNAKAPADLAARAAKARDPKARPEPAGGVDFFGARAEGTHICFVCDISGSMQGAKLDALRAELKRSIGALPRGTLVQVVFFSQVGHVLTPGWKATGTPACDALLRGIEKTGCQGGTDPTQAIEYAFTQLDPRPDTLFLLTDGQFEADVAGQLGRLNPPTDQTRVHTIGLGSDVLGPALQAIAAANGGTYVQVPANGP